MATRLRRRLILLAAVTALPVALVSGLALRALLEQQVSLTEQSTTSLARALATAVDNELRQSVSALEFLALTDAIQTAEADHMSHGHALAVRVLAARPEWRAVLLVRPSGEVLFNTGYPVGGVLPGVAEPSSLSELVGGRSHVIGSLARGPQGNFGIPIRVPVRQAGELRYVLTAILQPDAVRSIIARQRVPDDWVVSVFDAQNRRIARSRDQDRFLGTSPSSSLGTLLAGLGARDQAFGTSDTLEGAQVHTAVTRIGTTGWTVALGVPTSASQSAVRDSALAYGGGILLSIVVGGLAGWRVSRSIERPIGRLKLAAQSLGREEPIDRAHVDIEEIQAVRDALIEAGAQRAKAAAEREHLLAAERGARSTAESAKARLELLASAGTTLSTMFDEATTLQAIASVIVPTLADVCRIDLIDKNGVLQRKLTYHQDPKRAQEIADFVAQNTASADTPGSFPWAIATGKTFVSNLSEADVRDGDSSFREFARTVRMRAVCVVPLIARDRTIGVIAAIQAESGRQFSSEDQATISELAARAALALDNARLFADSQEALERAAVASRAKDEFLAMLGHELRNPLAPIVTSLELMTLRSRGTDSSHERAIIERQVNHLQRLVDDLLDVSRIASGKVELHQEPVNLSDVVARAIELTHPASMVRQSAPQVKSPHEVVWAYGDSTRLTQVLCNLLINATKFSPKESTISIEIRNERGLAEISVTDNGIGIDADLLPRVFDQFVQGNQSLNRASGGLGLGLAIAKNLVTLHGGTIEALSGGIGTGSTFTVRLPAIVPSALPASPPVAPASQPAAPLRILVVDDNVDAAESLASFLELEGHTVRTAMNGAEAMSAAESFAPNVAILDIGLPGMDGYELARRLREIGTLRRLRLVALTGYGRDADRELAREAGFDTHLVKPADPASILRTLAALANADIRQH